MLHDEGKHIYYVMLIDFITVNKGLIYKALCIKYDVATKKRSLLLSEKICKILKLRQ